MDLRAQFLHMFHHLSQQLLQPPQHHQGSCLSVDRMPEFKGRHQQQLSHTPIIKQPNYKI